jgi:hypothetical protein
VGERKVTHAAAVSRPRHPLSNFGRPLDGLARLASRPSTASRCRPRAVTSRRGPVTS